MQNKKEVPESVHAKKLRELGFTYLSPTRTERAREKLERAMHVKIYGHERIERAVAIYFNGTLRTHVIDEYGVLWNGPGGLRLSKYGLAKVAGAEFEELFLALGAARIRTH